MLFGLCGGIRLARILPFSRRKDQPVGVAGTAHFQNLIQYFGRHNRETK